MGRRFAQDIKDGGDRRGILGNVRRRRQRYGFELRVRHSGGFLQYVWRITALA